MPSPTAFEFVSGEVSCTAAMVSTRLCFAGGQPQYEHLFEPSSSPGLSYSSQSQSFTRQFFLDWPDYPSPFYSSCKFLKLVSSAARLF